MLPILISVSVAPVSYCFCADAVVLANAAIARAAEKAPNRKWIAGILISLIWLSVSVFLIGSAFRLLGAFNTFPKNPSTKSPLRRRRRGRHLVEQLSGHGPVRKTLICSGGGGEGGDQPPFSAPH